MFRTRLGRGVAVLAAMAAFGIGCTSSPTTTTSAATSRPASVATSTTSAATTSTGGAGTRPVEFEFLGVAADQKSIRYRITIVTDKPVAQVDLHVRYFDAQGALLFEANPLAWQNIVKSERQSIEAGKTYEAEDYLYPGTVRAEGELVRVVYTDGTRWTP